MTSRNLNITWRDILFRQYELDYAATAPPVQPPASVSSTPLSSPAPVSQANSHLAVYSSTSSPHAAAALSQPPQTPAEQEEPVRFPLRYLINVVALNPFQRQNQQQQQQEGNLDLIYEIPARIEPSDFRRAVRDHLMAKKREYREWTAGGDDADADAGPGPGWDDPEGRITVRRRVPWAERRDRERERERRVGEGDDGTGEAGM